MTYKTFVDPEVPLELNHIVFQSLGFASTCWEHLDQAGVFQEDLVCQAGATAIQEIKDLLVSRVTALMDRSGVATEWNAAIEEVIRVIEAGD